MDELGETVDVGRDGLHQQETLEPGRETVAAGGDAIHDQETRESGRAPAEAPEPAGGRLIAGRYRLGGILGRGGVGCVLRARDLKAERDVAVKLLLAGDLRAEQAERFRREGELAAAVRHPGVVSVHAAGITEDERPFLVYELIEGARTLRAELEDEADLRALVGWIGQAAEALGAAHAAGIVHRDVKPANVLIDAQDRARVTDFGAAMQGELARLTRTGSIVGTPLYMSPEQLTGDRDAIRPTADVWALGVMLYEAACGELPFDADNIADLMGRVLGGSYTAPSRLAPELPPRLIAVITRCLKQDPWRRYPDGAALAAALETAFEPDRRLPRAAVTGGLVAALALGAAWATTRTPDPAPTPAPSETVAAAPTPGSPAASPTADATLPPTADTGRPAWSLKVHRLHYARWALGGRRIVTSSFGSVTLWSTVRRTPIRTFDVRGEPSHLDVSRDGSRFVFGRADRVARIVSAEDGKVVQRVVTPNEIHAMRFGPRDEALALGGAWPSVEVTRIGDGKTLASLPTKGSTHALAWSAEGRIAVGGEAEQRPTANNTLFVWELTPERPKLLRGEALPGRFQVLRFHPENHDVLFIGDALGGLVRLDLQTKAMTRFSSPSISPVLLRAHVGRTMWIEVGPERRRIASATRGRRGATGRNRSAEVRVWELGSRRCVFVHPSRHPVERAVLSPDGRWMLLALLGVNRAEVWPASRFFK